MSLIRQIWLLLLGTVALAFAGSVLVTIGAARHTLQTQLRLKNSDNATALALALSQQKGNAELTALIISAQFDTGFYRHIRLTAPDGRVVFSRDARLSPLHAPHWFVNLLPIESTPGVAQVSDGWRPVGTLNVVSHSAYAHDDLWRGGLESAATLALIGLLAGGVGSGVVARIRRPLEQTVQQAQSLVAGSFVTVAEPRIPELRRLTRAMNTMVMRLKLTFEAQTAQVEALRQQANCDSMTGLANRKHFLALLDAQLQREDGASEGGLVLLRVLDLAGLNLQLGHAAVDRVIHAVAEALRAYTERVPGCTLGRLNGADFALCLPVGGLARETADAVNDALRQLLPSFGGGIGIAAGAVEMRRDRVLAEVMAAADAALARAEARGPFGVELGEGAAAGGKPHGGEAVWREQVGHAVSEGRVRLASYPVIDARRELIHLECPLRLQLDPQGRFEAAAHWLPLALRSRLTALVDERAVALALAAIAGDGRARCVNLSSASLADGNFAAHLRALALTHASAARLLSVEVPEAAAAERGESLREMARQLRPHGVRIGIEHAGERLARIERLFEAGIDYVKLDASVVNGLAGDAARAGYVTAMTRMLHGLSLRVYAEGVSEPEDALALWDIGIDGVTGPWASAQRSDLVA